MLDVGATRVCRTVGFLLLELVYIAYPFFYGLYMLDCRAYRDVLVFLEIVCMLYM